jgi:hypothetical protein
MAKITRRIDRANAGFSRKVSVIRDWGNCLVGPGGMPRQSNINGLLLQTSVLTRIEPKGVFGAVTNCIVTARRQAAAKRGVS